MKNRIVCWILVSLSIFFWGCPESGSGGSGTDPNTTMPPTRVIEFRPDIKEGGRITVLARQIASEDIFLAGGETGGMFRTTDKGVTWKHIDAFPALKVTDIEYLTPGIVVATAMADFRAGGHWVYRSTDGGLTWATCQVEPKELGYAPIDGFSLTTAKSLDVWLLAATSYGIAKSSDFGISWKWVHPQGPAESIKVVSIAAYGNQAYAAGVNGIFLSTDYGSTWAKSAADLRSDSYSGHSLAICPLFGKHAFFADRHGKLHSTTDGGVNWTLVTTPPDPGSRPAFVRIGQAQQGISMLYFGDGVRLYRRKVEWRMQGFTFKTNWEEVVVEHVDPCDVAFAEDGFTPVMAASDGGVFNTRDGGKTWQHTGVGSQGLHALQISEVTGQFVSGLKVHTDLYFATQDNYLHGSSDGGVTWPFRIGGEGYNTQTGRQSYEHMESPVLGINCADCFTYITDHHFLNRINFPNAPAGVNAGPPDVTSPVLLPDGSVLQWVSREDTEPEWAAMRTTDRGQSWTTILETDWEPNSVPVIAGEPGRPVLYQSGTIKVDQGFERKIGRFTGFSNGAGADAYVDSPDLSWARMQFRKYPVMGAGGKKGSMIIANDGSLEYIQMSVDSGKTWWDAKELTRAATDNGKFKLKSSSESFISTIAWDPEAPCQILVGTMQNGIIRSIDGGNNWAKIPDSEQILFPSSFFFFREDSVAVSTFGRGLWLIDLGGRPKDCREVLPPIQIIHKLEDYVILVNSGQQIDLKDYNVAQNCADCDLFSLRGGRIANVQLKSGKVDAVEVTGGATEWTPSRKLPTRAGITARPLSRSPYASRKAAARLPQLAPGERITGIYLRDQAVVAYRVTVPANKAEYKEPLPQLSLLRQGKPTVEPVVEMGAPLEISGTGFIPPTSPKIVLRIEGTDDSLLVAPRRTGGISTQWALDLGPGFYTLTATQAQGGNARIAELEFRVPLREKK